MQFIHGGIKLNYSQEEQSQNIGNLGDPSYPNGDRTTLFQEALEYQDYVTDLLIKELGLVISNYSSKYYQCNFGENRQGIEIKLDKRILDTGNVSIEVAEKAKAENTVWVDSGIMRKDNTWLYIQGNYKITFIFGKEFLKKLYQARYMDKVWEPKKTIKTFLFKIEEAEKYALKIFRDNGGLNSL